MEILKPNVKWRGNLTPISRKITRLIQHHMAHTSWTVEQVHNYHRDGNGWLGIGYSYWIGFDGKIYEGRGRNIGAHAGANWNGISYGIGYQGNFETQQMTDAQLVSGAWLNAKLIREEGLTVDAIVGHGTRFGGTSSSLCPGKNFRMVELKAEAEKILGGKDDSMGDRRYHTLGPRQTLSHVAAKFGVSVPQLRSWNGLTPADDRNLSVGLKLWVEAEKEQPAEPAPPEDGKEDERIAKLEAELVTARGQLAAALTEVENLRKAVTAFAKVYGVKV